jgi:hypothetical protein
MTRHLFFAITLLGTGGLLTSPAEAQEWQCEDNFSNCLGRCSDRPGGAGDWHGHQNKCSTYCDRQVIRCTVRAAARPVYWKSIGHQRRPAS